MQSFLLLKICYQLLKSCVQVKQNSSMGQRSVWVAISHCPLCLDICRAELRVETQLWQRRRGEGQGKAPRGFSCFGSFPFSFFNPAIVAGWSWTELTIPADYQRLSAHCGRRKWCTTFCLCIGMTGTIVEEILEPARLD